MRKTVKVCCSALILSAIVIAQAPPSTPKIDAHVLAEFATMIQSHPQVLVEAKRYPSNVGTPDFAKRHPKVGEYIAAHPVLIEQTKANPHFFDSLTATSKGGDKLGK